MNTNNKDQTASQQFQQLVAHEWEFRMQENPLFATYCGDHRFNDRLPHVTEDDFARQLTKMREFRRRQQTIDRNALTSIEQLNYDIFQRLLDNEIKEFEFCAYLMPISKASGFHISFPELFQFIPLETVNDYENYIARIAAFKAYTGEFIDLMRTGIREGYLPPRVTLEGIENSLKAHIVDSVEQSTLYTPFEQFPRDISETDRQDLCKKATAAILQSVVPAYQDLQTFVKDEYFPAAREEIGASTLPNGCEFYEHRIRYYTSLTLTPEEIHETGHAEVKRLRAEMQNIIEKVGFEGDFQAFVNFLCTEPRFYAKTPEELLKEVALVLKKMDGELPQLFKTLPRMPYGIRPIPAYSAPGNTTAYYHPPAGDGTRAGFYYVNTYDLKSRPFYEIEALSLHEAVPGHHLQIALQQELDLPKFRRFGGFTAFVEGWALYAERLGLGRGFYEDPYSNFGRLSYEMWRACRLVVDTGIHTLGWTRQQAIDFMAENSSLTLLNITNEVDRYISWPGQALAYKIGELKVTELRKKAEQALGMRFDVREFHDVLLGSGAVPLDVLENMIIRWVEQHG